MTPDAAREELAYFMRRLYELRLTTTSGGNLSCRIDDNTVAVTPTVVDKGRLDAGSIVVMDLDGTNRTPDCKPSIESGMHLGIFLRWPKVLAIVHAHPPLASASPPRPRQSIRGSSPSPTPYWARPWWRLTPSADRPNSPRQWLPPSDRAPAW